MEFTASVIEIRLPHYNFHIPELGEHSREIVQSLGYSELEIETLIDDAVI